MKTTTLKTLGAVVVAAIIGYQFAKPAQTRSPAPSPELTERLAALEVRAERAERIAQVRPRNAAPVIVESTVAATEVSPERAEQIEQAKTAATTIVTRVISTRELTAADRDALRPLARKLDRATFGSAIGPLFAAVNRREVKVGFRGPLL